MLTRPTAIFITALMLSTAITACATDDATTEPPAESSTTVYSLTGDRCTEFKVHASSPAAAIPALEVALQNAPASVRRGLDTFRTMASLSEITPKLASTDPADVQRIDDAVVAYADSVRQPTAVDDLNELATALVACDPTYTTPSAAVAVLAPLREPKNDAFCESLGFLDRTPGSNIPPDQAIEIAAKAGAAKALAPSSFTPGLGLVEDAATNGKLSNPSDQSARSNTSTLGLYAQGVCRVPNAFPYVAVLMLSMAAQAASASSTTTTTAKTK